MTPLTEIWGHEWCWTSTITFDIWVCSISNTLIIFHGALNGGFLLLPACYCIRVFLLLHLKVKHLGTSEYYHVGICGTGDTSPSGRCSWSRSRHHRDYRRCSGSECTPPPHIYLYNQIQLGCFTIKNERISWLTWMPSFTYVSSTN